MGERYDGHPNAAGNHVGLSGVEAPYSLVGLREGVIVEVLYTDQSNNRSRTAVEYTIRDLLSPEVLHGARRAQTVAGFENGDDDVLHAATKTLDGSKYDPQFSPAHSIDGDRVLYGLINGSTRQPVILGVLTNPAATYGAKQTNGERRYRVHKNTTIEIKSDGSYDVIRNVSAEKATQLILDGETGDYKITHAEGNTLSMDKNSVSMKHSQGPEVFVSKDGAVAAASKVFLGSAQADEAVIKGTTYKSKLDDLVESLKKAFRDISSGLQVASKACDSIPVAEAVADGSAIAQGLDSAKSACDDAAQALGTFESVDYLSQVTTTD